jgi:hypothetical protein
MAEFVYLYRSGPRATEWSQSPQQAQEAMQRWMAWLKDLTEKGHVKDPGHPLERSGKLVTGRARTVTDGPFAEAKDIVGGYTLVEAADLAQATALAAGCPIFELADGTVEVRPVMSMG